jgi:hypothetical protein
MSDWSVTLIAWLFPVPAAVLSWLILNGIERGLRLRIALALFVVVLFAMMYFWPAID